MKESHCRVDVKVLDLGRTITLSHWTEVSAEEVKRGKCWKQDCVTVTHIWITCINEKGGACIEMTQYCSCQVDGNNWVLWMFLPWKLIGWVWPINQSILSQPTSDRFFSEFILNPIYTPSKATLDWPLLGVPVRAVVKVPLSVINDSKHFITESSVIKWPESFYLFQSLTGYASCQSSCYEAAHHCLFFLSLFSLAFYSGVFSLPPFGNRRNGIMWIIG